MDDASTEVLVQDQIYLITALRWPGDFGGAPTPDPIPNSAVKRSSADGTVLKARESRSSPGLPRTWSFSFALPAFGRLEQKRPSRPHRDSPLPRSWVSSRMQKPPRVISAAAFCVHQCRRSGATSSINVSGIWSRSDQRKVIEDGAFLREAFLACFNRNVGDRLRQSSRPGWRKHLGHDNLLSSLGKQRLSRQG